MNVAASLDVTVPGFTSRARTLPSDELVLELAGTADGRAIDAMVTLMPALDAFACSQRVKRVVVDLCALEFMGSACFREVVTWLVSLDNDGRDHSYVVTFKSDPKHQWQTRSLHALLGLALERVTIETVAP